MGEELSKQEKTLYEYMLHNANVDVPIIDLCRHISNNHEGAARRAQQYIGAVISRINKKQNQYEIVPGLQFKRTYRLQIKTFLI